MNERPEITGALLGRGSKIRDILGLIGELREIREPLTNADALRRSLELLARFAEFISVDGQWIERIKSILSDENVFNIVLAIVRLLAGFVVAKRDEGTFVVAMAEGPDAVIEAQAFIDWLPLIFQLLDLLRQIRNGR